MILKNKKLVGCDVFDTAIQRKTYTPKGIFELIEQQVGNDFKNKRVKAEELAYEKYGCRANIYNIYEQLPEFKAELEIQTELENCEPNPLIYDRYLETDLDEVEVVFISDMYLPSTVIKQMLEKCGYENPTLFVSNEHNAHKGDGSLFKVVEEKIGRNIDLHFGDNYLADILGAKKVNIKPQYIPALHDLKTNIPPLKNTKLMKLLVKNEQYPPYVGTSTSKLNKKVAHYFAPMLYSFTKWVLDNRTEGQKIFFNARDGYLPYQIAKNIFKAEDIYYINASRKSVLSSSMNFDKPVTDKENEMQFNRLVIQRTDSIDNFITSINYAKDDLVKTDKETLYDFIVNNQDKLYPFFKENKNNAVKYFNKFNMSENDMIVDVGYFGTVQYAIEQIMGIKLKGYYLQTFEDFKLSLDRTSYFKREIVKYCLLIESFFSSSENGVYGYDDNGDPIYYEDNKQKKEFSELICNEIMSFSTFLHENNISPSIEDVEALTIRFLYYPTLEESNYCNESIFENGDIVKFESVVWYDRGAIKEGKLQECYNRSYWRPAFEVLLKNDKELCYLEKFLEKE